MHGDMGREVRTTTPAQERRHGRLREKAAFGIPPPSHSHYSACRAQCELRVLVTSGSLRCF